MSRRPNFSQALALKAAAAVAAQDDDDEQQEVAPAEVSVAVSAAPDAAQTSPPAAKQIGRPKGRRDVAARQTVYLDDARHAALVRLAEDRGRSIHSLIIEGIDHVIGKPMKAGWE